MRYAVRVTLASNPEKVLRGGLGGDQLPRIGETLVFLRSIKVPITDILHQVRKSDRCMVPVICGTIRTKDHFNRLAQTPGWTEDD